MQLVKKINTSAVLCMDGDGRQVVAMGRGLGFCEVGEQIDIDRVQRTFYDVSPLYIGMISELPEDALELASQIVDASMGLISYELSPNIAFILADHIAFAIKRARERIAVSMPLSYDLKQQYPVEYQIGRYAVKRINKQYGLHLPPQEAVGIAMAFVNNMASPAESQKAKDDAQFEAILDEATRLVERDLHVQVDRETVNYARFATHIQYLYQRAAAGAAIETENESMYDSVCAEYPEVAACTDHISEVFRARMGHALEDEEKLYLMLHVNRIAVKAAT